MFVSIPQTIHSVYGVKPIPPFSLITYFHPSSPISSPLSPTVSPLLSPRHFLASVFPWSPNWNLSYPLPLASLASDQSLPCSSIVRAQSSSSSSSVRDLTTPLVRSGEVVKAKENPAAVARVAVTAAVARVVVF